MSALAQPKALLRCICGDMHMSVARIGGYPVLECPLAPPNQALFFSRSKQVLIVGPESDHEALMPTADERGKSKPKTREH